MSKFLTARLPNFGDEYDGQKMRDVVRILDGLQKPSVSHAFVLSSPDETTALTTGTSKITFRVPYTIELSELPVVRLVTAQASGSTFTVDINLNGSTILSTKITVDNTETTSETAATPAVMTGSVLSKGEIVSVDIDQVGDGTAAGLEVSFLGVEP